MSFLAPWFVIAGVAAVSLPVLFHLLRRTPRGRMAFSTLMFLSPSPPRLTSRSRLENWPLLLLRASILVLLALAFGRPFLRQLLEQKQDGLAGRRTVVLIDQSASMRRGDLWHRAVVEAERIVERSEPHDETAVVAFAAEPRTLASFQTWREAPLEERAPLARAALAETMPTWAGTRLDRALLSAIELLDAADEGRKATDVERARRIVLISDMQSGAALTGLQGYEWPKNVQVEWVAVTATGGNAGLHWLQTGDEAAPTDAATNRPRLLVTNAADSKRESFELLWKTEAATTATGEVAAPLPVYIPPGQSRVVRAPVPTSSMSHQLVLRGDDESFDNTAWIVPPVRELLRVLHLSSEKSDDPQSLRYFLERAFVGSVGGSGMTVETVDPNAAETRLPTPRDLENVPLVSLAVAKTLPPAWGEPLVAWLEHGGVVVAVAQANDGDPWRALLPAPLAAADSIRISEPATSREYALLSDVDLRHPLFAPLADPRFSDFTKIRFQRYRRLVLNEEATKAVRVAARFDSGDPAIVEVPRGTGRVLLFAAGWQPRESQLGVSSKFVPLVQTMVELGRGKAAFAGSFETGATVDLKQFTDQSPSPPAPLPGVPGRGEPNTFIVVTPSGEQRAISGNSLTFAFNAGPGIYEIRSPQGTQRIAVNLPPDESKTVPLGPEVLETLGVRLVKDAVAAAASETAADSRSLQMRELEARQQLWRWCIFAALGVVIVETWYAGRTARREEVPA